MQLTELPREVPRVLDLGEHAGRLRGLALEHVSLRERSDDARIERPGARVIRLVRVEADGAPL